MPQLSPEWFAIRAGNVTGSTAGEWLLEGQKVRTTIDEAKAYLEEAGIPHKKTGNREYFLDLLPPEMKIPTYSKEAEGAKETAICELLESLITDETVPPDRPNAAMQRGTNLEPVAARAFEWYQGCRLEHVGFCQSIHGSFGCSPDGLIKGASEGLEIKVLLPRQHMKYLRAGVLPREYRMQVLLSLAVTAAERWHFWAWNPCLPPLHVVQHRDEQVERLKQALIDFSADIEAAKSDMSNRWDSWENK